jgi:uncharacterized protein (TIGR02231 family)
MTRRRRRFGNAGGWVLLAGLGGALGCAPPRGVARPAPAAEPATVARLVSAPDDPNTISATSSIRKVTVYSDRALVSRSGTVQVGGGARVYAYRHLPGWVDEGSVRIAASGARILDVRVVRSYLAHSTEQTYVTAEASLRELSGRLAALDDESTVLDAQAKQIEDIKAFSLERLNHDTLVADSAPTSAGRAGSVGVETYSAVVDFIGQKLRDVARGRRSVKTERERLTPAVEAAKKRVEDLRALAKLEETTVLVTLAGSGPGQADLQLTYMLPGATWEATHEFRATDGDPAHVEVTSYAVVTQASGEDWDGAELSFSTQSSTAAVKIPELEALTLGDTRPATQTVESHSTSFTRAEAAFRGQNRLWNQHLQGSSKSFEESYASNFESLVVTQSKTVRIFQSLQQRGTTTQFKALGPANVRADGRSVRVPIGHATLKAQKAIVAAPEQSLNAAQTLRMVNDSGQSILPGSVSLYQAGAFLGMTELEFVADGEDFTVFLNVVDQLKLSRLLDKKHSALVRKQRTQMQLAFVVTVENLSAKPLSLELADRVPVSEDREIVVSGVKLTPGAKPDSRGILRYALTLQPKEQRKLEIQYQIEYPPSLVVEMKRNRSSEEPTADAPRGLPSAPAPRRAYDIRKDIEHLEDNF